MDDNNKTPDPLPTTEKNISQNIRNVEIQGTSIGFSLEIHNFSQYEEAEKRSPLQTVSSANENAGHFCVSVYPKGNDKQNENYVGFSLRYMPPKDCGREVEAIAAILDAHKEECVKKFPNASPNSDMIYIWENMRFVSQEELKSRDLLPNDTLSILCYIRFSTSFTMTSENAAATFGINNVALRLFNDDKFSDITITTGEQSYRAHRAILAVHSNKFASMFEHHKDALPIGDMDSDVLREMLRFIYIGKVENMQTVSCGLIEAAEEYDLPGLKIMCEQAMCVRISLRNAVEYAIHAHLHNAKQLKAQAIKFMSSHAEELKDTERFKSMVEAFPELMPEDI